MAGKGQNHPCAAVILAAGKGTRMRSSLPKVMHVLGGRPLIRHVLAALAPLHPKPAVVVVAPGMDSVRKTVRADYDTCSFVEQREQLGTGHAVQCALPQLKGVEGAVLVLYGDTPLITTSTLARLSVALKTSQKTAVVVLGMRTADPMGYGRMVLGKRGDLVRIVECRDASPEEKKITLCNSGVMAISGRHLSSLLSQIENKNKIREFYLTDIVAVARKTGFTCRVIEAPAEEVLGINSRVELAQVERILQTRLRQKAMEHGATLIDPSTVYFSADTQLGQDVVVHPHVVFGPGVSVGHRVEIRSFSHLEGATVKADAIIGPFARLRPGAVVEEEGHIGNFVEIKKSRIGKGAKVNHLSYVGDTDVGAGANVGAGTITCNYDGVSKHKTVIGEGAFIGSNTALVAPVTIGKGAIVGAGSVITEDVADDALAIARGRQVAKPLDAKKRQAVKAKPVPKARAAKKR